MLYGLQLHKGLCATNYNSRRLDRCQTFHKYVYDNVMRFILIPKPRCPFETLRVLKRCNPINGYTVFDGDARPLKLRRQSDQGG